MYKWFEKYFAFSRRELNGICLLSVFLLMLWLIPRIYALRDNNDGSDLSVQIADIDHFLATVDARKSAVGNKKPASIPETQVVEVEYFRFDPNGLAVVDWKRLGLSDRQIRMIKNYEAKGGRFRKKEDFKKIYAINEADYARLAAYIDIEEIHAPSPATPGRSSDRDGNAAVEREERSTLFLDLNTADSLELQFLPGIGPVFASRIVRFRDLLGGFHDISQLMDVYGFDSLRFDGVKTQVYVDTGKVKKIAVNSADYDHLRSHPFISHKLANAIVQYRKQHGPYQSLTDLLDIVIMDKRIFRKIVPYLTVSND